MKGESHDVPTTYHNRNNFASCLAFLAFYTSIDLHMWIPIVVYWWVPQASSPGTQVV